MTTMLEKARRSVSEVAATMADEVRDVLSEAAMERVVRAVLMAVREPGDAMIEEGGKLALSWRDIDGVPGCKKIFTAMIDAILEGK